MTSVGDPMRSICLARRAGMLSAMCRTLVWAPTIVSNFEQKGSRNYSGDASSLQKQCDCIALIQLARRLLQVLLAQKARRKRTKAIVDTAKLHTSVREDRLCSL